MRFFLILFLELYGQIGWAQPKDGAFDFFGTGIQLPRMSQSERDSLIQQQLVPKSLKTYIRDEAAKHTLEDWSLVLFLEKMSAAEFSNESQASQVKIISAILTE